jgi:hypothetical protein
VIALKRNGQLTLADLDVGAAGRPALVQSRVDADDFSDRPFGRVAAGAFREADSEGVAEVLVSRLRSDRPSTNGVTETELKEVIIHLARYTGWPRAISDP